MTHLELRFDFSLKGDRQKTFLFLSIWVCCSILDVLFCNCIAYYELGHLFDVIYIRT